jgi:hypothetical protein
MAATVPVHRCRFVDNTPSAITALAFPPLPLPSVKTKRKSTDAPKPLQYGILAIGHANGNIDISEWMGSEHEPPNSQAWVVRQVRDVLFESNARTNQHFLALDPSRALSFEGGRACSDYTPSGRLQRR